MDDLLIRLSNGTRVHSPATLQSITTYVLLEQETWFEKEFSFLSHLLKPGMTVIDVGANLGVFSVAMAKLVGPAGRVFAYEPTSETRARLERTKAENRADNLTVIGHALSDSERTGRLVFGTSSEFNRLGTDGEGEAVRISSLDRDGAAFGWGTPDLIKIDAEGEEIPILLGAAGLLAASSPILIMEVTTERGINNALLSTINTFGYRAYRLLRGAPLLVPVVDRELGGEINIIAVRPAQEAALEASGVLVRSLPEYVPRDADIRAGLTELRQQPFAVSFPVQFAPDTKIDPQYLRALGAYHVWRQERPAAQRLAALRFGIVELRRLCEREGNSARLSTLGRMLSEEATDTGPDAALEPIVAAASSGPVNLAEPFWPAHKRYDHVETGRKPAQWFMAAVSEQLVRSGLSSGFKGTKPTPLNWLATSQFATPEMQRRRCLIALRHGRAITIPAQLTVASADHLNAELWRDGTIERLPGMAADGA